MPVQHTNYQNVVIIVMKFPGLMNEYLIVLFQVKENVIDELFYKDLFL